MRRIAAVSAGLCLAATAAQAQGALPKFANQGVTDAEVVIGTHQDLSGPIKAYGINGGNGMKMAVEEINASGGINGRKLRLIMEDVAYDPKKAVLATQKMIELDKVFAMVGTLGSPTTLAPQPIVLAAGVFQLFPISSAEFTYQMDPAQIQDRLKFATTQPYPEATKATMREMMKRTKATKPCVMYQDDEFGKNIYTGFMAYMDEAKIKPASITTYKRGATEFSSQIARMRADGCDLVFLATIVRETIGAMTEGRKMGWDPVWATSAAANVQDVVTLGKEMVEGLYATGLYETPYEDLASPKVKEWIATHRKMFGGDPNTQTIYGYNAIMNFACYARMAGKDLNGKTMLAALESGKGCPDIFGSKPLSFSTGEHLYKITAQLHQIKGGRWVTLNRDLPM